MATTTAPVSEEQVSTDSLGEEGPYPTTDAIGEEDTTTAYDGEEAVAASVSTVDNPFGAF
jgi:hypothetical protein